MEGRVGGPKGSPDNARSASCCVGYAAFVYILGYRLVYSDVDTPFKVSYPAIDESFDENAYCSPYDSLP